MGGVLAWAGPIRFFSSQAWDDVLDFIDVFSGYVDEDDF